MFTKSKNTTQDRGKVGKRSRLKGSSFERRVAKYLNEELYNDNMRIRRTPYSGSFDKRLVTGDLMDTVDPLSWPFSAELKNREDWSFDSILAGKCDAFWSYWDQCIGDLDEWMKSNGVCKYPLLIFTKNFSPVYVMCDNSLSQVISGLLDPLMVLYNNKDVFYFYRMESFFQKNVFKAIQKSMGVGNA